jgi:hypothetical protein
MKGSVLTRYFSKRRKKLQALTKFAAINGFGRNIVEIGDDPTYLVHVAVTPKQSPYLPYIAVCATVRAGAHIASATHWEWHDIVGEIRHSSAIFGQIPTNRL